MSTLRRPRWVSFTLLSLCLFLPAALRGADTQPAIDWDKARTLHQRDLRGEKLTADEKTYLDRARLEYNRTGPGANAGANPGNPGANPGANPGTNPGARPSQNAAGPGASVNAAPKALGLVPLPELGTNQYKGQTGGLYGDGRNEPPEAHLKAAQAALAHVRPLDAQGQPAAAGKIVLLAIGMSNTTQEFSAFKALADQDPDKNPKLVIVDGAQGGQDSQRWVEPDPRVTPGPAWNPGPPPWPVAEARLRAAGVTDAQVQVVWIKQARIGPGRLGEFPKHADILRADIAKIAQMAKERFPNLRVAYLSNRIFAGYATTQLNPEPYAYESAFAVRGLILDQIKGSAELNSDPQRGPVKAPVLLWGPYLWADGSTPRKSDGLVYLPADLAPDGTHPSGAGRLKVAGVLLHFFKTDELAKRWFGK